MKVDSVKAYTLIAFNSMVNSNEGVQVGDAMTFLSTEPITYQHTPLDETLKALREELDAGKGSMLARVTLGAGVLHKFELFSESGVIVNAHMIDGVTTRFDRYGPGLKVLSEFDRVLLFEQYMPMDVAEKTFRGQDLKAEKIEAHEAMQQALDLAKARREFARGLGMSVGSDDDFQKMIDAGSGVVGVVAEWTDKDMGKTIGQLNPHAQNAIRTLIEDYAQRNGLDAEEVIAKAGTVGGKRNKDKVRKTEAGTLLDIEQLRFVRANVTDLTDVGMPHNDHFHDVNMLRVAHLGPAEWHEPDEAMQAQGYIGYWQFDQGALMTNALEHVPQAVRDKLEDDAEYVAISFGVTADGGPLRLAVRSQDAITPAGEVAIPDELYKQLTGHEPEGETMDAQEMDVFNKLHLAPWPAPVAPGERAFRAAKAAVTRKAH